MHYYSRNLGDYYKKTARLTLLEHGVYNVLIDACYDREQFPTYDDAIDWVGVTSEEEINALNSVLKKCFNLVDGLYVQTRIQEEISQYQDKCLKNKEIGKLGGRPKSDEKTTVVSEKTNVVQKITLTNNHKPITNNHSIAREARKATQIDPDYKFNDQHRSLARSLGVSADVELGAFTDYHKSKGSLFKDWDAAFRTWLRNAAKFNAGKSPPQPQQTTAAHRPYTEPIRDKEQERLDAKKAMERLEQLARLKNGQQANDRAKP